MTEKGNSDLGDRHVDLSALGARDPAVEDRMVRAAMQRIAGLPTQATTTRDGPIVRELERWWRPGLVAAAAVIALAGGSFIVRAPSSDRNATVEARMLDWLASGNGPKNADLLSAFAGSGR